MLKKGFIIDPHSKFIIERDVTYDDTRVDDMYYKVDGKDLIPIAYIYPWNNRAAVLNALDELKAAKQTFEKVQSNIFYKVLPELRK